ncbi:transglutaminase domain-containing protein [Flavobacterium sp.]|uniref:transglutaminase domain-containing protein n=1 Tax=Flavobacterium sp. TaxID=239 RepID=UPI00286DFDCE|nr:transglutaminase domain-containing protein [Flavobacterium sp.]
MKNIFLIFIILFSIFSFGQANVEYAAIDKKVALIPQKATSSTREIASYINTNFKTENDKIRAVFYWTASNISYDVANMFAVNTTETPQDRITKALKTKKGICADYSAIFNEIATLVGINSVVISGYTKQNGKIDTLPHSWCAAKIDNKWWVFDPTWGSGSLINGQFVKRINDYYFKTQPSKIISSHIPFDYLWQFLNYPITNTEFYEGKTQIDTTKKYFDFEKEIAKQKSLSEMDQLFESALRIEQNGLKNAMIVANYKSKNELLTFLRQSANIDKLNGIVKEINEAVVLLNDFISYKNKRFKPTLPDDEIINMIQKPREKLVKCQKDIYTVGSTGPENAGNLSSIKKAIESNLATAEEQALFVKNYMSKSKMVRKTMFSKVTYFGIPLN